MTLNHPIAQLVEVGQYGQTVTKMGNFSAGVDDALSQTWNLTARTTDATPVSMYTQPSISLYKVILANSQSVRFEARIVACSTAGESAAYTLTGLIERRANAGTTAIIGSVTKVVIAEDTAAWDVAATADTTNGALDIAVTGAAATTINWVCRVFTEAVIA